MIGAWFALVVLCAASFALARFDRRLTGTWFTPANCLNLPFCLIVLSNVALGDRVGFFTVAPLTLLLWFVIVVLIWLGSASAYVVMSAGTIGARATSEGPVSRPKSNRKGPAPHAGGGQAFRARETEAADLVAISAAGAAVVASSVHLWLTMRGHGLHYLVTAEFQLRFGTGVLAHIRLLGFAAVIYLIGTLDRRKTLFGIRVALAVALIVFALVYQVKGWLFLCFIGPILYRAISGRLRIRWWHGVVGVVVGCLGFTLTYVVSYLGRGLQFWTSASAWIDLGKKLFIYVWGGLLGFDALMSGRVSYGGDPGIIFTPFLNMWRLADGQRSLSQVTQLPAPIAPDGTTSNVYTFAGTLVLHLGWPAALVYCFVTGAVLGFGLRAAMRSGQPWLLVAVAVGLTALVFGWFEFYFWNLGFVEVPVMAMGLWLATTILSRYRARRSVGASEY